MKCQVCGKEIERSNYGGGHILCSSECFNRMFWLEIIEDDRTVVINGKAYTIGREDAPDWDKGFGGALHRIKYYFGLEVETTNLSYRGEVPAEFRDQLPDNAEFIK